MGAWVDEAAQDPVVIAGHWFRIDAQQRSEGPVRCNISEATFLRYVHEDGQSFPELSSDRTDWSRDFGFAVSGLQLVPGSFDCVRPATVTEESVPVAGTDPAVVRKTVREVYDGASRNYAWFLGWQRNEWKSPLAMAPKKRFLRGKPCRVQ
jgi:hypothetical protein